jgi:hypothetical protein
MMTRTALALTIGTWSILTALVWGLLLRHEHTPGRAAEAGVAPAAESTPAAAQWTLAIFFHPRCPCSVSSLEQAAALAERLPALRVQVYLVRPPGCAEGWEEGGLSRQARTIPGAQVIVDVDGREARRRGVHTSGQVFLTDASGQVRFRGGLTNSRGMQENSAGAAAVVAIVEKGISNVAETEVFGCPVMDDDTARGACRGGRFAEMNS